MNRRRLEFYSPSALEKKERNVLEKQRWLRLVALFICELLKLFFVLAFREIPKVFVSFFISP